MSSGLARCSWRHILQLRQHCFESLRRMMAVGGLAMLSGACIPSATTHAQDDSGPTAGGVAAQPDRGQEPNPIQERIAALIEQLGSERFQEREAASSELLAIGEPALLALATAENGADAEVRERAGAIRGRIERDKFTALAQSFMRDPDPTASYGLPGWKSFSQVAGSTRTAKRLFLDMVEKRRLVALSIEAVDGGTLPAGIFEELPADPQQRLWTVVGLMCREIRQALYQKGDRPVTGDVIALLTAVATLDNPPQDLHDTIKSEFQFGGFQSLLAQPGSRACARKMLGKWFLKAPLTMAEDVISIAHQTQVPEGADMARRVLGSQADASVKAKALICLSRFGGPEDLDLVDKYVDDTTSLEIFEHDMRGDDIREERVAPPMRQLDPAEPPIPGTRRKYQRTLGDVALATGLKIAEFDLLALFPIVGLDERMGIRETTIGFPVDDPELRAAALKTWRDFRDKKTSPPAIVQPAS